MLKGVVTGYQLGFIMSVVVRDEQLGYERL